MRLQTWITHTYCWRWNCSLKASWVQTSTNSNLHMIWLIHLRVTAFNNERWTNLYLQILRIVYLILYSLAPHCTSFELASAYPEAQQCNTIASNMKQQEWRLSSLPSYRKVYAPPYNAASPSQSSSALYNYQINDLAVAVLILQDRRLVGPHTTSEHLHQSLHVHAPN